MEIQCGLPMQCGIQVGSVLFRSSFDPVVFRSMLVFNTSWRAECRRNVWLVCTVLEQSTELSMPDRCSKVLRCRGTNREFGSVQLAENARLLTDEGCSLSVLDVHKRSSSRLVRFFRLVRSLFVRYLRLVRFFRLVRFPAWLQVSGCRSLSAACSFPAWLQVSGCHSLSDHDCKQVVHTVR